MGIETILIGAAIGAALSAANYAISYAAAGNNKPKAQDNAREVNNRVQGSRYGAPIERIYGTVEKAGQVIWATNFLDTVTRTPGQKSKRGSSPEQINHSYSRSFAVLFGAAPAGGIEGILRIKADDKVIYEGAATGAEVVNDKLHIYLGTETQMPNSWIEADKGVGKVSAHRGYIVVIFKDFVCDDYGDRIPNMRAEIVESVEPTLAHIVESECAIAGLTVLDLNTTELTQTVSGFFISSTGPVRASLEQLSQAYQFAAAEYDGVLNFLTLPRASEVIIPYDLLGASEDEPGADDEPTPALTLRRGQSAEIASTFDVGYYDRNRNYEEGTGSYTRQHLAGDQKTSSFNFPLVMAPVAASRLAKILAITAWTERTPAEFSLPPDYLRYTPGTVFTVPVDASETEFIDVRAEQLEFAAPGVVRVKGVEQIVEAYDQEGDAPPPPPTEATRYEAELAGNTFTGGAVTRSVSGASNNSVVRLGSLGSAISINSIQATDSGAYQMTLRYMRAAATRVMMRVNGGTSVGIVLPSSGGDDTGATITRTIYLREGANTIEFTNLSSGLPLVGQPAPDIDYIEVLPLYEDIGAGNFGRTRLRPPIDDTELWFGSVPPLADSDNIPRYYVAGYPRGSDTGTYTEWSGSQVIRDLDGEGQFEHIATLEGAATIGMLLGTLPSAAAGLDTTNTVDVYLRSGTLASVTNTAFENSEAINQLVIDSETLQVRDVLALGNHTVRLSHFKRGARETTPAAHDAGETCVLINEAVQRVAINETEVGTEFDHYGVTLGSDIDATAPVPFTAGVESGQGATTTLGGDLTGSSGGDALVQGIYGQEIAEALGTGQSYVRDSSGFLRAQTVALADLAPSRVRVYRATSRQAIATGTTTIVQFNGESFDTNNDFAQTTWLYAAPRAGFYEVRAVVEWVDLAAGVEVIVALYKNGSEYSKKTMTTNATGKFVLDHSDFLSLASGDTLSVRVRHNAASAEDIEFGEGVTYLTTRNTT